MIVLRSPLPGEIEAVGKNAAEQWVRDRFLAGGEFSDLFQRPHTKVALIDDMPVAAGGFIDRGGDNAVAWSLVGHISRQYFVTLCRSFRRGIIATPFSHIEAHCFETFQQSHRWVRCLGFSPMEGLHRAPDGRAFRRFVFRNFHDGY